MRINRKINLDFLGLILDANAELNYDWGNNEGKVEENYKNSIITRRLHR